jgi:hypothetical protein
MIDGGTTMMGEEMFESTIKGVLSIAPNAVCDEDKAVVDEVRERNIELTNRLAQKDQVLNTAIAFVQNNEEVDKSALLGILLALR